MKDRLAGLNASQKEKKTRQSEPSMQLETSEPVGHVWMRGKKRLLLIGRPNGAMAQAVEHVIGVALGDAAGTRLQVP